MAKIGLTGRQFSLPVPSFLKEKTHLNKSVLLTYWYELDTAIHLTFKFTNQTLKFPITANGEVFDLL